MKNIYLYWVSCIAYDFRCSAYTKIGGQLRLSILPVSQALRVYQDDIDAFGKNFLTSKLKSLRTMYLSISTLSLYLSTHVSPYLPFVPQSTFLHQTTRTPNFGNSNRPCIHTRVRNTYPSFIHLEQVQHPTNIPPHLPIIITITPALPTFFQQRLMPRRYFTHAPLGHTTNQPYVTQSSPKLQSESCNQRQKLFR